MHGRCDWRGFGCRMYKHARPANRQVQPAGERHGINRKSAKQALAGFPETLIADSTRRFEPEEAIPLSASTLTTVQALRLPRNSSETKFYNREILTKKFWSVIPCAAVGLSTRFNMPAKKRKRSNEEDPPLGPRACSCNRFHGAGIGATSADAAPMVKHRHHHHHRHHPRPHHHHHHHHHHMKKMMKKA